MICSSYVLLLFHVTTPLFPSFPLLLSFPLLTRRNSWKPIAFSHKKVGVGKNKNIRNYYNNCDPGYATQEDGRTVWENEVDTIRYG